MSTMTLIIASALTTGTLLGPGGGRVADEPLAVFATLSVLALAMLMSLIGAWRLSGHQRAIPAGPTLPKVKRRMTGPNPRRL